MAKDVRQDCVTYMKNKNLFFKDMEYLRNVWDYSDYCRVNSYFGYKKIIIKSKNKNIVTNQNLKNIIGHVLKKPLK